MKLSTQKDLEQEIDKLDEKDLQRVQDFITGMKMQSSINITKHNSSRAKKLIKWSVASFVCLVLLLFTTLFGGVVLSSDFRNMVFNALEGNGKVVISSEMKDLSVCEENLADVLRLTALDGQGYSIRADGDFAGNYTLTYSKAGNKVSFDVRKGETQLFLDTDWTGWKQANRNGCIIYISNKPNGCVLEMLMQDGIKCSIISNYLTSEETLDLSKSIGLQADTNT